VVVVVTATKERQTVDPVVADPVIYISLREREHPVKEIQAVTDQNIPVLVAVVKVLSVQIQQLVAQVATAAQDHHHIHHGARLHRRVKIFLELVGLLVAAVVGLTQH
jgi:vacuolar-type H+-ATPase subunit D/Vma8